MNRLLYILLLLSSTFAVHAQWTAGDSLWLRDVLSGKDTIRLNPETMQSIRQGTFLNFDNPQTPLGSAPLELPITKDFDEYFSAQDTLSPKVLRLTDIPSHIVLRHYNPRIPEHLLFSDEYYYFYLKNGTRGIKTQSYNFSHGLNMAFSPEYRQWIKNQKNAAKLVHYNELPKGEQLQKHRQFLISYPQHRKPAPTPDPKKENRPQLPLPEVRVAVRDSLPATDQPPEDPVSTK